MTTNNLLANDDAVAVIALFGFVVLFFSTCSGFVFGFMEIWQIHVDVLPIAELCWTSLLGVVLGVVLIALAWFVDKVQEAQEAQENEQER